MTRDEAEQVMKRCQVGTRNYEEANNLHAECFRIIGKLLAERTEQEPVAHLWQHGETGRTRVTFPDSVTDCDASWFCVGPLVLGNTHPPQRTKVVFPTMLRKMWSGGEVQAWLDENVNKENT